MTHLLRKEERAHTLHRKANLEPQTKASKHFWQNMRIIQGKIKQTIIPDLKQNGDQASSLTEKAQLLNDFFCQQTNLSAGEVRSPEDSVLKANSHSFDTLRTSATEVLNVLTKLKTNKAPETDGVLPKLLRICAAGISSSLSALFNRSFESAEFPAVWKDALVVRIFKKGDRSSPGNYRPIALLPILSKVLERIVHNKLYRSLQKWLVPDQSGFH